jgi:HAD superfamily hydrolase (TIGR01509 family)
LIKGVIFDLDGTIIDSMKIWTTIDRTFLKECGVDNPPDDVSERVRKMSVDEAAEYFISQFELDMTKDYIINRIEELVRIQYEEKIVLKPDVMEILDLLDSMNIPYGIATATYRNLAEAVLRRHGLLERFRFILTDREYPAGKTSPDIFYGAAERLGYEPEEILVVEDSLHCIESSVSAGFFTVGVYDSVSGTDREKIESTADAYIMRLRELKTFIRNENIE